MRGHTVLTGDIIASSDMNAEELDEVMTTLQTATDDISAWGGGRLTGFARRGGDGWQIVVQGMTVWLRAALYVQASLRRLSSDIATRIAIATTSDDLVAPARSKPLDPNEGHGPAFTASGRLLGELGRDVRMGHAAGGAAAATIRLADTISAGWTQAQARALCEMLGPDAGPRAAAAKRLGISRSAVNKALWSSGYLALKDAIDFVEREA